MAVAASGMGQAENILVAGGTSVSCLLEKRSICAMGNKKEKVALSSVFASALMTAMKLVVGLMTGSLGILSEAAHSLLDLGAASLTWFAVRVSDKPADDKHPYGHGKIENVSALIETGLLFLTSGWIIKEAITRLMAEKVDVETTWYGVAVIVISIAIDFSRSRALMKVAKETGSQALEADALHFSSDILSSAVVLVGLGFVAIGWDKGDAIAALGVAGFVLLAAYRMGKRTIDVLIDTAPDGVVEQVSELLASIPEVARIERIRARPAGASVFVEAVVKVGRGLPLEQVKSITDTIRRRINERMPNVDPLVIAEPLTLDSEDVSETVRVAAANQGLAVHDIGVYTLAGRRHVGFDLEVDEALSLRAAHNVASSLEGKLAQELGDDVIIDVHIDPRRNRTTDGETVGPEECRQLEKIIREVVGSHPLALGFHRLFAQRDQDGIYVTFHCTFAGKASVKETHDVVASMEVDLRRRLEGVGRMVVHAEPEEHDDGPVVTADSLASA